MIDRVRRGADGVERTKDDFKIKNVGEFLEKVGLPELQAQAVAARFSVGMGPTRIESTARWVERNIKSSPSRPALGRQRQQRLCNGKSNEAEGDRSGRGCPVCSTRSGSAGRDRGAARLLGAEASLANGGGRRILAAPARQILASPLWIEGGDPAIVARGGETGTRGARIAASCARMDGVSLRPAPSERPLARGGRHFFPRAAGGLSGKGRRAFRGFSAVAASAGGLRDALA